MVSCQQRLLELHAASNTSCINNPARLYMVLPRLYPWLLSALTARIRRLQAAAAMRPYHLLAFTLLLSASVFSLACVAFSFAVARPAPASAHHASLTRCQTLRLRLRSCKRNWRSSGAS